MFFKKQSLYFVFIILSLRIYATHIVGGEIYYDYLGNNTYKITLKVYRDCYNGVPPLDNPAHIDIFDANGNVIKSLNVPLQSLVQIPRSINNSCIQAPNTVCVQEGTYQFNETLPPLNGGYYIVYQRCCRNQSIINLINPGGIGATYIEHIPGPESVFSNSSPRFNTFPPIFICNGLDINYNHSATDPDGDSLVYSLCNAYNGLDGCCPAISPTIQPSYNQFCNAPPPNCPTHYPPPPYTSVPYMAPYNGSYPLSSNPAIAIDPHSGHLTGKPDMNGQWVVSVCVSEYRNGQLIGVHQREFQFNVVTCTVTVVSAIQSQSQKCDGYTINFGNQSIGSNTFFWDFGDPTTQADTSSLVSPTYTYPDTGIYIVTLIANPGKPCADTSKKSFYVYPKFSPQLIPPPPQCITNNSFSFSITGNYANYTQFNWNFTNSAIPPTSSLSAPNNIHFDTSGIIPITVTVTQMPCQSVLQTTIQIYPAPQINFTPQNISGCAGTLFRFNLNGQNIGHPSYQWYFSNGTFSTDSIAYVTFHSSGLYSYSVNVQTAQPCAALFTFNAINSITVFPKPVANYILTPTLTTIFDSDISFKDSSNAGQYENNNAYITQWAWNMADGNTINAPQFIHNYADYGQYPVSLIVTNNFGCKDTVTHTVIILPEFRFWVPNTFTPNNDGLNDVFLPIVLGVENYSMEIYNRWGEKIFFTNNSRQGWNGYYKGNLCQEDIYVWKINFKNLVSRKSEEHVGHVTLLR